MKYFEVNKKPQVEIGFKAGKLTVCSKPYYKEPPSSNNHRRQFFDCQCDCGKIKEFVFGRALKQKSGTLLYCSRDCELYQADMPFFVPESHKKCKLGDRYNYLTVVKEAFYHKFPSESNRHKCVEVQCDCGNKKIYREDKLFKGQYKSCGCVWEHSYNKQKDWKHIEKKYGINQEEYEKLLAEQNYQCAICKSSDSKTSITKWLFVDHCHKTGKVRGLLCNQCNAGIGAFSDNIETIKNSIDYLLKYSD